MTSKSSRFIAAISLGALTFAAIHSANAQNPDWTRPFPPFKMIGHIYWVGSYDLSTYLITSPQGHILINTGVGDTAKQIKASFRWDDTPSARFEPVKVDRTFRDGKTISLGETELTAHYHPGHTKGATSSGSL
jgi:glyoxylase-like metal-dependent hydrolase (beta-lactamase superfamily II)